MPYSLRPAVRGSSFLVLLLAAGCGDPAAPADTSSPVPDDWNGAVQARLAAAARAITPDGAGWRAELTGASLRLHAERIEVEADGERALTVRWKGWGREVARGAGPATSGLGACVRDELPDGSCVRRLEHVHDGVTAWYLTVANGFEQGFDVDAAPEGEGALVFETEHEGALSLETDGDLAWLTDARGALWTISDLAAWDADGDVLPAWMEVEGDVLRLVVDDDGATYPITVDPLYTTAATTLTAPATGGAFAYSLDVAGDVNGDGYDDVVIGAQDVSSSAGAAYVYHGSASGLATTAARTLTGSASSRFGQLVAAAGDTDCDGYDDILVSNASSTVYVYEGSSSGISSSSTSSWSGTAFASVGDLDANGCDDVAFGTYSTDSGRGYVLIAYGGTSGLGATKKEDIKGTVLGAYLGSAVAGTDYDGDGYSDLVVGAFGSKAVYVYRGSSTWLSGTASKTWTGSGSYGAALAAAGDVDGDGKGDVLVNDVGTGVYVHTATSTSTLTGSGDFGLDADGAGDLDQDGYDDIIVSKDGTLYQYRGTATGVSGTVQTTITGATSVSWGQSIAGDGDFDGDGYPDVIVGAGKVSGGNGAAYVYEGYADADSDGVAATTDCDDADATVGAAGKVYRDADGDGYGTSATTATACVGSGYVASSTDCNDASSGISPAATETAADGVDQTCDGQEICYVDGDDDGYRLTTTVASSDSDCSDSKEALATEPTGDCDDASAAVSPGDTEIVGDGIDEDCDGDEVCYGDADEDGYTSGTVASADTDCGDAGEGTSSDKTGDCNDAASSVNPGATEVTADGVDQTCDAKEICYADGDSDGYRTTSTIASADADCSDAGEALSTVASGDCADSDSTRSPGATETVADGTDSDCDGAEACYADADGDSYRTTTTIASADGDCTDAGEATSSVTSGDCDDSSASAYPGATETAGDGVDSSCDGAETCYADADDDGYRVTTTVASTDADCGDAGEALSTEPSGDCDDVVPTTHPGAAEIAGDNVDQSCDGYESCYYDADRDGFRSEVTFVSPDADCLDVGEAGSAVSVDCDDTEEAVKPGATELPGDDLDQDCDGGDLCYADADADGFRTDTTVASDDLDCADPGEAAASVAAGDCDDGDAAYHPTAPEDDCTDPNDYDCDGSTLYADLDDDGTAACVDCDDADPAVAAESVFYTDADGDGFGDASSPVSACEVPSGAAAQSGDCDEADPAVNPGAAEIVADGLDQDCDAKELCFLDADADGWRPDASSTVGSDDVDCDDPGEANGDAGTRDCDDGAADAYPFAPEVVGDGVDQDCDGEDEQPEKKGCNTAPGASGSWAVLAALGLMLRRRARA
jgi:hypothetical protein